MGSGETGEKELTVPYIDTYGKQLAECQALVKKLEKDHPPAFPRLASSLTDLPSVTSSLRHRRKISASSRDLTSSSGDITKMTSLSHHPGKPVRLLLKSSSQFPRLTSSARDLRKAALRGRYLEDKQTSSSVPNLRILRGTSDVGSKCHATVSIGSSQDGKKSMGSDVTSDEVISNDVTLGMSSSQILSKRQRNASNILTKSCSSDAVSTLTDLETKYGEAQSTNGHLQSLGKSLETAREELEISRKRDKHILKEVRRKRLLALNDPYHNEKLLVRAREESALANAKVKHFHQSLTRTDDHSRETERTENSHTDDSQTAVTSYDGYTMQMRYPIRASWCQDSSDISDVSSDQKDDHLMRSDTVEKLADQLAHQRIHKWLEDCEMARNKSAT